LNDDDFAQQIAALGSSADLVRVNDALLELERIDRETAEVAEMRFFGGYSESEMAEIQGVAVRTISRRWERAKAWLFNSMYETQSEQPPGTDAGNLSTN
jgi:DNA-directed RNA polymerase specialized sigma24 family protein